jgi:predicted NUDIX family phosphoesterase
MSSEEQILVVPTAFVESIGTADGFSRDVDRVLKPILASDQLSFRPRGEMEMDPRFKQLIPYVILQYKDSAGEVYLFTYTRGKGQGEARLRAKRSFGIGGHISEEDAAGGACPYETGMRRELDEEVTIRSEYRAAAMGLINDNASEVGRVHLGVVHRFELVRPDVVSNEDDLSDASFVSLADLRKDRDRLEGWSQICLDELYGQ